MHIERLNGGHIDKKRNAGTSLNEHPVCSDVYLAGPRPREFERMDIKINIRIDVIDDAQL